MKTSSRTLPWNSTFLARDCLGQTHRRGIALLGEQSIVELISELNTFLLDSRRMQVLKVYKAFRGR